MRILVVAAHPDDEVLGVGGTIAKYTERGHEVYTLILADGVGPRYPEEMKDELKRNATDAGKALGVKEVGFVDLPDEALETIPFIEVIKPIEKAIDKYQSDVVYTHHRGDANTDHQIVFRATIAATRPLRKTSVREVLCYECLSSTEQAPSYVEYAFLPNVFEDITLYLDKKIEAMKCYKSELLEYPHPRSIRAIKANGERWGMKIGVEYAEGFSLVYQIKE